MTKGPQPDDVHPNSLAALAARDPELRRRIREGRRKADEDLRAIEIWASGGTSSSAGGSGSTKEN